MDDLLTTSAFDLPHDLAAKADPALLASDEAHFARIAAHLETTVADLTERLAAERRAPGGGGQEAMDRDLQIHRLSSRLRLLERFRDRKSTRLNSSHVAISYAVFCLKKKNIKCVNCD